MKKTAASLHLLYQFNQSRHCWLVPSEVSVHAQTTAVRVREPHGLIPGSQESRHIACALGTSGVHFGCARLDYASHRLYGQEMSRRGATSF